MYDEVKWVVNYPDSEFPDRLRRFLYSKYSTLERAIQSLQVPTSTLYSYIPRTKGKEEVSFVYPGVPFLLKLAGLGCNLHWLITGEGEMETDVNDLVPGWAQKKKETMEVLSKYELHSPEHLDEALAAATALTQMSKFISGGMGLTYRTDQEQSDEAGTATEQESPSAKKKSKRTRK